MHVGKRKNKKMSENNTLTVTEFLELIKSKTAEAFQHKAQFFIDAWEKGREQELANQPDYQWRWLNLQVYTFKKAGDAEVPDILADFMKQHPPEPKELPRPKIAPSVHESIRALPKDLRAKQYATMISTGLISVDEVRKAEGLLPKNSEAEFFKAAALHFAALADLFADQAEAKRS